MSEWRVVNRLDPDRWVVIRPVEFERCTHHGIRIAEVVEASPKTALIFGYQRGDVRHFDDYKPERGQFAVWSECDSETWASESEHEMSEVQ